MNFDWPEARIGPKVTAAPVSESPGKPTPLQAIVLLVLFLGFQTALGTVVAMGSMTATGKMELSLAFLAGANAVAFVAAIGMGVVMWRAPWRDWLRLGGLPARFVPAVLLTGVGGFVLCSEIENATRYLLPMPAVVSQLFNHLFNVSGNPAAAAVALVVVAPLTEELLCRGWLLNSLLDRSPPLRAIGVSAVVFGAMHMNPWQFPYATALGLAFGWIYWRTRSLWLCVLAHALNNGVAWGISYSGLLIPGMSGGAFDGPVQFQSATLNAVALVLLVLGMAGLWAQTRSTPIAPHPAPSVPPPLPPASA